MNLDCLLPLFRGTLVGLSKSALVARPVLTPDARFLRFSLVMALASLLGCDDAYMPPEIAPTATEVCESIVSCLTLPTDDAIEGCREYEEAKIEDARVYRCIGERNALALCTMTSLHRSDAGVCDFSPLNCIEASAALGECIHRAGGSVNFACSYGSMFSTGCVGYREVPPSSRLSCEQGGGTVLEACSEEGLIGTCQTPLFGYGGVAHYYGTISPEALMRTCENQPMGVWTSR